MIEKTLTKGDLIICMNNKGLPKQLTLNKQYVVINHSHGRILLQDDQEINEYYREDRFTKYDEGKK